MRRSRSSKLTRQLAPDRRVSVAECNPRARKRHTQKKKLWPVEHGKGETAC